MRIWEMTKLKEIAYIYELQNFDRKLERKILSSAEQRRHISSCMIE